MQLLSEKPLNSRQVLLLFCHKKKMVLKILRKPEYPEECIAIDKAVASDTWNRISKG
jgi:hypothetical protein